MAPPKSSGSTPGPSSTPQQESGDQGSYGTFGAINFGLELLTDINSKLDKLDGIQTNTSKQATLTQKAQDPNTPLYRRDDGMRVKRGVYAGGRSPATARKWTALPAQVEPWKKPPQTQQQLSSSIAAAAAPSGARNNTISGGGTTSSVSSSAPPPTTTPYIFKKTKSRSEFEINMPGAGLRGGLVGILALVSKTFRDMSKWLATSVWRLFKWSFKQLKQLFGFFLKAFKNILVYGFKALMAPFKLGFDMMTKFSEFGGNSREEIQKIDQSLSDTRDKFASLSRGLITDTNQVAKNLYDMRVGKGSFYDSESFVSRTFGQDVEGISNAVSKTAETLDQMKNFSERFTGIFRNADQMAILHRLVGSLGLEAEDVAYHSQEAVENNKHVLVYLGEILEEREKVAKINGVDEKRLGAFYNTLRKDITNFDSLSDKSLLNISAKFQRIGLDAENISEIFNKFSTFEDAAKSAAMLSQTFGMHIDPLKLIETDDPLEIINMFESSLKSVGRTFESMNRHERKILADNTGLSIRNIKTLMMYRKQGLSMAAAQKKLEQEDPEDKQITALKNLTSALDSFKESMNIRVFTSGMDALQKSFTRLITGVGGKENVFNKLNKQLQIFGTNVSNLSGPAQKLLGIAETHISPVIAAYTADGEAMTQVLEQATDLADSLSYTPEQVAAAYNKHLAKEVKDGRITTAKRDQLLKDNDAMAKWFTESNESRVRGFIATLTNEGSKFKAVSETYKLGMKSIGIVMRAANAAFKPLEEFLFGDGSDPGSGISGILDAVSKHLSDPSNPLDAAVKKKLDSFAKMTGLRNEEIFNFFKGTTKLAATLTSFLVDIGYNAVKQLINKLKREFMNDNSFYNVTLKPILSPFLTQMMDMGKLGLRYVAGFFDMILPEGWAGGLTGQPFTTEHNDARIRQLTMGMASRSTKQHIKGLSSYDIPEGTTITDMQASLDLLLHIREGEGRTLQDTIKLNEATKGYDKNTSLKAVTEQKMKQWLSLGEAQRLMKEFKAGRHSKQEWIDFIMNMKNWNRLGIAQKRILQQLASQTIPITEEEYEKRNKEFEKKSKQIKKVTESAKKKSMKMDSNDSLWSSLLLYTAREKDHETTKPLLRALERRKQFRYGSRDRPGGYGITTFWTHDATLKKRLEARKDAYGEIGEEHDQYSFSSMSNPLFEHIAGAQIRGLQLAGLIERLLHIPKGSSNQIFRTTDVGTSKSRQNRTLFGADKEKAAAAIKAYNANYQNRKFKDLTEQNQHAYKIFVGLFGLLRAMQPSAQLTETSYSPKFKHLFNLSDSEKRARGLTPGGADWTEERGRIHVLGKSTRTGHIAEALSGLIKDLDSRGDSVSSIYKKGTGKPQSIKGLTGGTGYRFRKGAKLLNPFTGKMVEIFPGGSFEHSFLNLARKPTARIGNETKVYTMEDIIAAYGDRMTLQSQGIIQSILQEGTGFKAAAAPPVTPAAPPVASPVAPSTPLPSTTQPASTSTQSQTQPTTALPTIQVNLITEGRKLAEVVLPELPSLAAQLGFPNAFGTRQGQQNTNIGP